MDRHVDLLGWLWLAAGALSALVAVSLVALTLAASALGAEITGTPAARLLALGFGSFALFAAACGLGAGLTGLALRRRRPWARGLGLTLAGASLLLVPFGTALGVYTLWVLLSEDARRLFVRQRIS